MKVLSLGLGIQSTALYVMSSLGEIDRADVAIFADPGAEHPKSYELLEWLNVWAKRYNGIRIIHATSKNLYEDLIGSTNSTGQRFASIPAFTGNGTGMLRRQCTKEYKIDVIVKAMRREYDLKPRQRMPMSEMWIGISVDEIHRMTTSRFPRIINRYHLIEEKMTRNDCIKFLEKNNIPKPVKSACVFCPFQGDPQWKNLKLNSPGAFKQAIKVDESIRDSSKRGVTEKIYLHRSCRPLKDVDFESQQDLFGDECDGYCGV